MVDFKSSYDMSRLPEISFFATANSRSRVRCCGLCSIYHQRLIALTTMPNPYETIIEQSSKMEKTYGASKHMVETTNDPPNLKPQISLMSRQSIKASRIPANTTEHASSSLSRLLSTARRFNDSVASSTPTKSCMRGPTSPPSTITKHSVPPNPHLRHWTLVYPQTHRHLHDLSTNCCGASPDG